MLLLHYSQVRRTICQEWHSTLLLSESTRFQDLKLGCNWLINISFFLHQFKFQDVSDINHGMRYFGVDCLRSRLRLGGTIFFCILFLHYLTLRSIDLRLSDISLDFLCHGTDIRVLQHLLLLPFEDQLAVQLEVYLAWVHVQTGVKKDLALEVHLVDQSVHVLALDLVQHMRQVEEPDHVERDVRYLAELRPQIVLIETLQSLSHKVASTEQHHS